jgi:hypothetical protein
MGRSPFVWLTWLHYGRDLGHCILNRQSVIFYGRKYQPTVSSYAWFW